MKQTVESLFNTVDFTKHRLFIIDNNSCKEAVEWLIDMRLKLNFNLILNDKNLGTAGGINVALKERNPGEMCLKCDDDLTWSEAGWVEKLEEIIFSDKNVGICGLKRDDVYGNFRKEGNIWWQEDIFGTCTAYNPLMLDKCGFLSQPSCYGFDDILISVRSEAAGFKNCFRVDIPIVNLDEGGTEYTEWKKREAGVYLQEVGIMCDMIRNGDLSYYYDGGFND